MAVTQDQKKMFGDAVAQARKAANLTQIACAKHCGVSIVSFQNWERGVCAPKQEKMKLICDLLNLNREDFE